MHVSFAMMLFTFLFPIRLLANCEEWFQKSELKKDSNCELSCLSLKVDMSTFTCKDQCEKLCKNSNEKSEQNIYGLTDDEIKLVKKEPALMSRAYVKSWNAEVTCGRIYKVSDTNDKSDACRHFIWAAMLTESFGREKAEEILNAHEHNPRQPEDEKAMDLANNRRGVSVAEKLLKEKRYSEDVIVEEFKKELENGNLTVLKKDSP